MISNLQHAECLNFSLAKAVHQSCVNTFASGGRSSDLCQIKNVCMSFAGLGSLQEQ